jgi:hypothetical protein
MVQVFLLAHDLFRKPVSTYRVRPEGMLFGIMLDILVGHDLFRKPVTTHRVKPEGMLFGIML